MHETDFSKGIRLEDNCDEYTDLIVELNSAVYKFVTNNPNVYFDTVLNDKYAIVKISSVFYDAHYTVLRSNIIVERPFFMGLSDISSMVASEIISVQEQPYLNLKGSGVLVGLIDTGIDYTNPSFIYEDGTTKIRYLLDQTLNPNSEKDVKAVSGTVYTAEDIDIALSSSNPLEKVPCVDEVGHGTFLASIMAGKEIGKNIGAAPDADLIVVKLKPATECEKAMELVNPEEKNVFLSTDIMRAVKFMYEKASELNMPISVCIGLGTNSGEHNGSSIFEEYLSDNAKKSGRCISISTGNQASSKLHTSGVVAETGQTSTIEINVGENENGFLFNLWNFGIDSTIVSIVSPLGETVEKRPVYADSLYKMSFVLERTIISVEYNYPLAINGDQCTSIRFKNPTPGIWKIIVYGENIVVGEYHAWLPLPQFMTSNTYFLQPTPSNTITVPATANNVISVGGYDHYTGALYADSGRGPDRSYKIVPTLVAPAVEVGGEYPYGFGTMTGTSVAAAHVAGAAALILEWGIVKGYNYKINTQIIEHFLTKGCTRDANVSYPNTKEGYGKLNLMGAFTSM